MFAWNKGSRSRGTSQFLRLWFLIVLCCWQTLLYIDISRVKPQSTCKSAPPLKPKHSPNRFTRVISADDTYGGAELGFHSGAFNGPHSTATIALLEHLLQQLQRSAADFFFFFAWPYKHVHMMPYWTWLNLLIVYIIRNLNFSSKKNTNLWWKTQVLLYSLQKSSL